MGVGLVVTDANHVDSMMVEDYSLDCAWGKDENDFELTVDKLMPLAYLRKVSAEAYAYAIKTDRLIAE